MLKWPVMSGAASAPGASSSECKPALPRLFPCMRRVQRLQNSSRGQRVGDELQRLRVAIGLGVFDFLGFDSHRLQREWDFRHDASAAGAEARGRRSLTVSYRRSFVSCHAVGAVNSRHLRQMSRFILRSLDAEFRALRAPK